MFLFSLDNVFNRHDGTSLLFPTYNTFFGICCMWERVVWWTVGQSQLIYFKLRINFRTIIDLWSLSYVHVNACCCCCCHSFMLLKRKNKKNAIQNVDFVVTILAHLSRKCLRWVIVITLCLVCIMCQHLLLCNQWVNWDETSQKASSQFPL